MAEATKKVATVTKVGFNVQLSGEEAGALLDVLYKVGGGWGKNYDSPRARVSAISRALEDAGAKRGGNPATGIINFQDTAVKAFAPIY